MPFTVGKWKACLLARLPVNREPVTTLLCLSSRWAFLIRPLMVAAETRGRSRRRTRWKTMIFTSIHLSFDFDPFAEPASPSSLLWWHRFVFFGFWVLGSWTNVMSIRRHQRRRHLAARRFLLVSDVNTMIWACIKYECCCGAG